MPARLIDPNKFAVEAAIVDWGLVARQRPRDRDLIFEAIQRQKLPTRVVHLRWQLNPEQMGMPTEPFRVWIRPSKKIEEDLRFDTLRFFTGHTAVDWHGLMAVVTVELTVSGSSAVIMGLAGSPSLLMDSVVTYAAVGSGSQTVTLYGQALTGLLIAGSAVTITRIRGISVEKYAEVGDWQPIEIVGLPVDPAEWAGIGQHDQPQGFVTALTDPRKAAYERLQRGAPIVGWHPELAPGIAAPIWKAPDPEALIAEVRDSLLPELRTVMQQDPLQQLAQTFGVKIPPPQNAAGESMRGDASEARVSALGLTLMGAATDPFLSLVLGFGTAFPDPTINQGPNETLAFDYMVTARWENGIDGSEPVEYAAFAPSPSLAILPPAPANMLAEHIGYHRPLQPDGNWTTSVRVSWDRLPPQGLLRVSSFAAAKAGLAPASPAIALMEDRKSGGFKPIAGNTNPKDPEPWRMNVVDRTLVIPANPGTVSVRYGVATQTIFGLWSPWISQDHNRTQPNLEAVRLVAAELKASSVSSGTVCPGELVVDWMWDWRVRRPQTIQLVGKLYAAAHRGDGPPDASIPTALPRSLGSLDPALTITFGGDVPSVTGATIQALSPDGESVVAPGPAQGNESRRYRITIPGFALDFASTGHIGIALWAFGTERIAPHRSSPAAPKPYLTASSDPRPPKISTDDHVQLASLPDATGQCHARIRWAAAPGAVGYFIYESTETKILAANGLPEPTPEQTLDQRLAIVKARFRSHPSRRDFTRRNATLITDTSTDITLPKGSTAIHLFVVLAVSAGQVESEWPAGATPDKALISVAAPRVMVPAVPMLEVQQVADTTTTPITYRARVAVQNRPGPRVQTVELFRVRVDDAARDVNTMGPAIATVSHSGSDWTATRTTDTAGVNHLVTVTGTDTPNGSWKRVWYRAVAWSNDDPVRGAFRGRSPASPAVPVVIPPSTPPHLSGVTLEWAGGALTDVLLSWTSLAPIEPTPLGNHRLAVDADVVGAPRGTPPLTAVMLDLDQVPSTTPSSGSGVWRDATSSPSTYHLLLRRPNVTDAVAVAIRLTDPLGRTTERLIQVPAGPVDPPPDVADVKVVIVPGQGVALTWSSTSPITPTPAGSYRLSLVAVLAGRTPPRPTPTPKPGPILPRPGPILPPGFGGPPLDLPDLTPRPKQIKVELALGDIPVLQPPRLPPGSEPLVVWRQAGRGERHSYAALCRATVRRFILTITAPDGRSQQVIQEVN